MANLQAAMPNQAPAPAPIPPPPANTTTNETEPFIAQSLANLRPQTTANTKALKDPEQPNETPSLNVYIYDKYTAKYTMEQLNLALSRSRHCGQLSAAAFWLWSILAAIILDYLKIDFVLFKESTYTIVSAYDMGTWSNIKEAKFGWIILAIALGAIIYLTIEAINSRTPVTVIIGCSVLLALDLFIILVCIIVKIPDGSTSGLFKRYNLLLVILAALIWLVWTIEEMVMLIISVRKMADRDFFPRESLRASRNPVEMPNVDGVENA